MADLLVYGSYGYTGNLVVEAAVRRGLEVVVAGRDRDRIEHQRGRLQCEARVVSLDEPKSLDYALEEVPVVIHCAGPFADTYAPMVRACLRTGTQYLDITGEIEVFEAIARMDEQARDAGVMLLPGAGFDVVPTDCLGAHLADRLPDATSLALGFDTSSGVSPGTARTVVRGLGDGVAIRRDGRIESVPTAADTREIDFGRGERSAMLIPWGDVSTAYHTTGIPNVRVYQVTHPRTIRLLRLLRHVEPLLGTGPVQSLLEWVVDRRVEGPDERERADTRADVWGEVENADGDRAVSRLETPNGYTLTARAALEIAERVLDGDAPAGYQTPASAYGPDLVCDVEGVEREDVV
ncbi:MAG: trans-acting enoyl reductase family protein [Haloarculaceae archaeon]